MCGCKANCTSNRCKCLKNNLICTDTCKFENCQNIDDSSKQNDGDNDDFELSHEVEGEWCTYIHILLSCSYLNVLIQVKLTPIFQGCKRFLLFL